MNRPLNAMEQQFFFNDINVVIKVLVRGTITPDALEPALKKLQLRHPPLRVRVQYDERHQPWFITDDALAIPFRIERRTSPDQWVATATTEIDQPFEEEQVPLLRAVVLQGEEEFDLILASDHCISDGLSLVYLARDLLEFLADPEKVPEELPEIPDFAIKAGSQEEAQSGGSRSEIPRDGKALRQARVAGYETHLIPWAIPSELFSRFHARCRAEGVTVHAGICIAVFLNRKQLGNFAFSATNLRPYLPQNVGEACGFYALGLGTDLRDSNLAEFWKAAKEFATNLSENMKILQVYKFGIPMELFAQIVQTMDKNAEISPSEVFFVTNIGQLTIPSYLKAYSIEDLYIAAREPFTHELCLSVATLSETPYCTFFFDRRLFSVEEVNALISQILATMTEVVAETSE